LQGDYKTQNILTFLVILNFVVGMLVVYASSGSTNGQLQTLNELAQHTPNQIAAIPVGANPDAIGVDGTLHKIFVVNSDENTVSVISSLNDTKIGDDIKVGRGPSALGVNDFNHEVYVANSIDDTVSVISSLNDTKIGDDIKVGSEPTAIGIYAGEVYVANKDGNTVSVIDSFNHTKIGNDIQVGGNPDAIGISGGVPKVYVANNLDDTVSVIDVTNHTKIGNDIKVGNYPTAIAIEICPPSNCYGYSKVYVANHVEESLIPDNVSVINSTSDTKIGNDIKVGNYPTAIAIDNVFGTDKVYVANKIDDTVSVINATNDTKIEKDIQVGRGPSALGVDSSQGKVYVTNSGDNTVSIIDEATDKVVAAVTFSVKPFNAGHIECGKDKLVAPTAQQFYIGSGSECTAIPNQGFGFVSWQENLGGNSSRVLQFASPTPFYEPILDFFHLASDKPEAALNITKFGGFTVNFKALPPPIPPEYVATLFTVVITAFVGTWLTPTVIGWRKTRKEGSRLNDYRNEIKKLYNDGKLDMNDIHGLNNLKDNIKDQYLRGKINKEQYDKLADEISISYGEILTKEIDSLNKLPGNDKVKQLSATIRNIEDMHASLKKETSILYQELFNERIVSLNSLQENDKGKTLAEIKDDISDAYSKGKISELHYSLLKEKLSNYENPKG